ncbi:hypothetical protein D3C84_1033360 [compost metagenome]
MGTAQILQAHADPQQSHRLATTGKGLAEQLLIATKVTPRPRLLKGGLAEIMELHFDERLARAITVIDTCHAPGQGFHQLWEFFQATGQVR